MRKLATAVALASLTLITACGGDSETEPSAASGDASSTETETTEPGTSASASPSASESAGSDSEGGGTLIATVGEEGDPDAFTITLTDESGQPVETLPAGEYEVQVSDLSAIHNFHLTGGDVDETTTVPEIAASTWTVDLQPGEYTFVCDPHPQGMVGQFQVT